MPKIAVVVPTNRPERMAAFKAAWMPLFSKHDVTLIVVHDGDDPWVEVEDSIGTNKSAIEWSKHKDLVCRKTDAVRNLGFIHAASGPYDYILTLDDDVAPLDSPMYDPIQSHLDALDKKVPDKWMSTTGDDGPYPRGVPYSNREARQVVLSHGVWVGVPDFDGETQLRLEQTMTRLPYDLSYHIGPIPEGVHFPLCGMNVMVKRKALPYFYFAPMGPDSGWPDLHRFADIFMGIAMTDIFKERKWASYTGASFILHTRASDARKNMEQEKLGRKWLDEIFGGGSLSNDCQSYLDKYAGKRYRYAELIEGIL